MTLALQASGTVEIDGASVPYYDAGPHQSGRLPLLLVHGTAGSTNSHFGYLFPMLAYRQRVISLDLSPGADPQAPLQVEDLVRQVMAVAERVLGPGQPFALAGYSLGAVVAAATAGLHPGVVRQLVLVAGWIQTDTQQQLRSHVWHGLRQALPEGPLLREFMAFCAFSPAFMLPRSLADLQGAAAAIPLSPWVDRQMALNSRVDISTHVAHIRAATLVIGCSEDQMVPRHHSLALFGAIEDARYLELASGHAVVFERPAELFHAIDQFTRAPQAHAAGTRIPATRP